MQSSHVKAPRPLTVASPTCVFLCGGSVRGCLKANGGQVHTLDFKKVSLCIQTWLNTHAIREREKARDSEVRKSFQQIFNLALYSCMVAATPMTVSDKACDLLLLDLPELSAITGASHASIGGGSIFETQPHDGWLFIPHCTHVVPKRDSKRGSFSYPLSSRLRVISS